MTSLSPRKICAAIALLTLAQPVLAHAQTRIAAGYQYQHDSTLLGNHDYPLGLGITAEHAVSRSAWSLVADIATSSTTTEATYLSTPPGVPSQGTVQSAERRINMAGGLRWTGSTSGFHPHAQALFGAVRGRYTITDLFSGANPTTRAETDPLLQIGAGVTQPIAGRFAVIGQVDYRRVFGGEANFSVPSANLIRDANEIRVLIGAQIAVRR